MSRNRLLSLALVVVLALVGTLAVHTPTLAEPPKVLAFDTMVGVSGPFKGPANPIRGVNGGGLAWTIDEGSGELFTNGRLEVTVRGLVLAEGANEGINPAPSFRAIVSCLTIDGDGNPAVANVTSDPFPASRSGDADIQADLILPSPCFAPIIFVTSPTGAWFAVTGQ